MRRREQLDPLPLEEDREALHRAVRNIFADTPIDHTEGTKEPQVTNSVPCNTSTVAAVQALTGNTGHGPPVNDAEMQARLDANTMMQDDAVAWQQLQEDAKTKEQEAHTRRLMAQSASWAAAAGDRRATSGLPAEAKPAEAGGAPPADASQTGGERGTVLEPPLPV